MQRNNDAIAANLRQAMVNPDSVHEAVKKATNQALLLSKESDRFCMTVKQFAERMQISLPIAYELTHSEGFPLITVGRKRLIPIQAFEKWLDKQTSKVVGK